MKVIKPDDWPRTPATAGNRPGGTATISDFLRFNRGLAAVCPICLHSSELDLAALAARLGADHPCSAPELRAKLECSVCKSMEAILQDVGPARRRRAASAAGVRATIRV